MQRTILISSLVLCSSCSATKTISTEEQLCRASILGSTISPETVEFLSFEPVGKGTYSALVSTAFMQRGAQMDEARHTTVEAVEAAAAGGAVFSTMRVRQPDRLSEGKTVSVHGCVAEKGSCECFLAYEDEVGEEDPDMARE